MAWNFIRNQTIRSDHGARTHAIFVVQGKVCQFYIPVVIVFKGQAFRTVVGKRCSLFGKQVINPLHGNFFMLTVC